MLNTFQAQSKKFGAGGYSSLTFPLERIFHWLAHIFGSFDAYLHIVFTQNNPNFCLIFIHIWGSVRKKVYK